MTTQLFLTCQSKINYTLKSFHTQHRSKQNQPGPGWGPSAPAPGSGGGQSSPGHGGVGGAGRGWCPPAPRGGCWPCFRELEQSGVAGSGCLGAGELLLLVSIEAEA